MDPDNLLAISADARSSHNDQLGSLDADGLLAISSEARLSHPDRLGSSADESVSDMSDVFVLVRCPTSFILDQQHHFYGPCHDS